ncbi:hypothetical protein SISSUDRAFT_1111771 [Sistotremastrum suecicum HHB10207 ss-3]|uniref:Endonuclease n=1 Tax=Sistotremastrum suecicum HHB10207 ss-3 TaxID=1314776 RepID=A0A166IUP3_9AGAM|nr:hypothetical protein SISSUDRAFT_1111771 [Sistotremastrum suecicum HHB10207 ss-3]
MPGSTLAHLAGFAAGAAVGALAANAFNTRRTLPASVPAVVEKTPENKFRIIQDTSIAKEVLKYGHPGPVSDLLTRQAYVAAYDRRLRHPAWTAEHLTLSNLRPTDPSQRERGDRSKSEFKEDESLPAVFRATLKDYFRSGYDRGHMVPAADAKSSQTAMNETFLLSNIAPQVGDGFNRHYWAYLEEWCRRLTDKYSDVFIFTVPLYLPKLEADGKWRVTHEVIGNPPNIAVPTHFAKVVLTAKPVSPNQPRILEVATGAFVLPNAPISDETPLEKFLVPVEAVERAAGLIFFSEDVKQQSKNICQSTKCEVIVRRFDNAQKSLPAKPSKQVPLITQ